MFVRLSKTKAIKKRQRQWQIISSSIVIFLRAPNFPPTKFRQTSSTWQELLQQKKSIFPLPFWPYCIHQNIKWISPCNLQKQGKRICLWKKLKRKHFGNRVQELSLELWANGEELFSHPPVRLFKYFTATIVPKQFYKTKSYLTSVCLNISLQQLYYNKFLQILFTSAGPLVQTSVLKQFYNHFTKKSHIYTHLPVQIQII